MPKLTLKLLLTKSVSWDVVLPQVREISISHCHDRFIQWLFVDVHDLYKSPFQDLRSHFYGVFHDSRIP